MRGTCLFKPVRILKVTICTLNFNGFSALPMKKCNLNTPRPIISQPQTNLLSIHLASLISGFLWFRISQHMRSASVIGWYMVSLCITKHRCKRTVSLSNVKVPRKVKNWVPTNMLLCLYMVHRWRRRKNKLCLFLKGNYLEEYMVLNMKMGNGRVGRIEN